MRAGGGCGVRGWKPEPPCPEAATRFGGISRARRGISSCKKGADGVREDSWPWGSGSQSGLHSAPACHSCCTDTIP